MTHVIRSTHLKRVRQYIEASPMKKGRWDSSEDDEEHTESAPVPSLVPSSVPRPAWLARAAATVIQCAVRGFLSRRGRPHWAILPQRVFMKLNVDAKSTVVGVLAVLDHCDFMLAYRGKDGLGQAYYSGPCLLSAVHGTGFLTFSPGRQKTWTLTFNDGKSTITWDTNGACQPGNLYETNAKFVEAPYGPIQQVSIQTWAW